MIEVHWTPLALGLATGAAGSALYFAGLALGMRVALARRATTTILLASAALRIGALLALGLAVARQGGSAFAGFAVAFLLVRLIVVVAVRPPGDPRPATTEERAPWS